LAALELPECTIAPVVQCGRCFTGVQGQLSEPTKKAGAEVKARE